MKNLPVYCFVFSMVMLTIIGCAEVSQVNLSAEEKAYEALYHEMKTCDNKFSSTSLSIEYCKRTLEVYEMLMEKNCMEANDLLKQTIINQTTNSGPDVQQAFDELDDLSTTLIGDI